MRHNKTNKAHKWKMQSQKITNDTFNSCSVAQHKQPS